MNDNHDISWAKGLTVDMILAMSMAEIKNTFTIEQQEVLLQIVRGEVNMMLHAVKDEQETPQKNLVQWVRMPKMLTTRKGQKKFISRPWNAVAV